MTASADQVLAVAASQIGYYAKPGTSSKYGDWYGLSRSPWCAMFVSWAADQAGALDIIPKHAYTPSGANWFKARGQWGSGLNGVRRGDIVFFDFPDSLRRIQHVGFVESVNADGSVNTIEGNTSGTGSQANGGALMRKRRKSYIVGYGRPNYAHNPNAPKPPADTRPRNKDGSLTIAQDGVRGAATNARWQEVMNTPIDGVISKPDSSLIRADQTFLNTVVGAPHILALTGRSSLVVDGDEGAKTVIVRQFWLRNAVNPIHQQNLLGHPLSFDGVLGPDTNRVHQFALNHAVARSKSYGRV